MPKRRSFDDLIEKYEQTRDNRRQCAVCDGEYRDLIDEMLRRRGGGPSISQFLERELNFPISASTIARHRNLHLDATA